MALKGKNSAAMGFTLLSCQDTVMRFTNTPKAVLDLPLGNVHHLNFLNWFLTYLILL